MVLYIGASDARNRSREDACDRTGAGRAAAAPKFITRTLYNRIAMEKYRRKPESRSFKVTCDPGTSTPWRVEFFVDGIEAGGGQYQTAEQADDAGVSFMFSGDLDG